jgi:hypothetical protein
MVIWTDQKGGLNWSTTTDSLVVKVGMLELTKQYIAQRLPQD